MLYGVSVRASARLGRSRAALVTFVPDVTLSRSRGCQVHSQNLGAFRIFGNEAKSCIETDGGLLWIRRHV